MSLRILHLASLPVEPPFLSAHAANAAWLAPALRERGHDVTLRVVEQPATTAAAADSEGFDIVHIHDATSLERPVPQGRDAGCRHPLLAGGCLPRHPLDRPVIPFRGTGSESPGRRDRAVA